MFGTLHSLLGCVLIDRVQGFASEEELEQTSHDLMQTNDLLAAVVFFDQGQNRRKRASNQTLPDELRYEIRMDIDYVQSTTRLKKQFWIPGPEADFIEDLRYLRGFVQLQDSIDKSIIHLKAPKLQKWTTLVQQMPYPCYKQSSCVFILSSLEPTTMISITTFDHYFIDFSRPYMNRREFLYHSSLH